MAPEEIALQLTLKAFEHRGFAQYAASNNAEENAEDNAKILNTYYNTILDNLKSKLDK